MSLNNKLVLFGSKEAGVYLLSNMYDPDIDGEDPNASGKVVPAIGSTIIDDTTVAAAFAMYTVVAFDNVRLKATLSPAHILTVEDGGLDRIIGYGNDTFMLYYNDRVTPTELMIDDKLVIFGTNSIQYRLLRSAVQTGSSEATTSSMLFPEGPFTSASLINNILTIPHNKGLVRMPFVITDADDRSVPIDEKIISFRSNQILIDMSMFGTISGTWHYAFSGIPIPITEVGATEIGLNIVNGVTTTRVPIVPFLNNNNIRKCKNCKTTTALVDNELITMEIFNQAGFLTMSVKLITKRATSLADQEISTKPIVEFKVNSNQQADDGSWFLFTDQAVSNLAIHPSIVYSDGTEINVAQNDTHCFIYGLEDVNTLFPGMTFPILIKYYITDLTPSLIAQGKVARYLSATKLVQIRSRELSGISKVSVVPYWNGSIWALRYFAYSLERDTYSIIAPSRVSWLGTQFNGSNVSTRQDLTLQIPETLSNGAVVNYTQTLSIRLAAISSDTPYIYADASDSVMIYGSNTLPQMRPLINYDTATGQYLVAAKFTSMEEFLNNFFFDSYPPYDATDETVSPTPTHFKIRDGVDGHAILQDYISVTNYALPFNLITTTSTGQYANTTVVVEFFLKQGNVYSSLFGVPVDIKTL